MLCPYCNQEIPENSKFCSRCGRKLAAAEPQAAGDDTAIKQPNSARILYEEMCRLRAESEERLRREAREQALRAEEERLRRKEEERQQAELRRHIREEEMERRRTGQAPLSADGDAEIRARLQMEIEEMRRRVEEERRRAEEEANLRREAEERVRQAAEQRRLYEEEQQRRYEEARRRQMIEEEMRRRKEADEELRRQAEEAERRRLAQRALLQKAVEDSRQRVEALHAQMESVRKNLEAEEERLRDAEVRLRVCDEQAAAGVPRPDVGALNDFLKRLRLRSADTPSHEIDRKVAAELAAEVAGAKDEGGALLEVAAVRIRAIADALVGRFGSLTPVQATSMLKVAYAVADCAMPQMFLHPKDERVERCMNAIDTIDRLQEIQQRAVIATERRDRWYVLISVLSGENDRESMGYCASVLRAIADRRNGALEQLQQTLSQLAAGMIEACVRGKIAEGERREVFDRAVLAELYAQLKFGANGRMGWAKNVVPDSSVMHALQCAGLAEVFSEALNRLIKIIVN